MKNKNIQVSIIIVNYKVEKELLDCISSIVDSKPKIRFEMIIVDNGSGGGLKKLMSKFGDIKYIKSPENIGFSAGNNLGAGAAQGEYLFFLNPDAIVKENSLDILYNFAKNNPQTGMIAPLLFDPHKTAYPNQGSNEYNLISSIVTSSFINKLFPNNPVSRKFFHKNWTKNEIEEFDVVPGTAFMISKALFENIGMFDEKYFLYFEEYDLAKRIKKLGYKNYIVSGSKVIHIWEASTKKRKDIDRIFSQSRYYFFKKNYGRIFAFTVELFSNIGKNELLIGLIAILSAYLGFFRIRELMPFIGDQGWFYLSARNMLINGQIPLVGIASSHPWLHQGPFWSYLLATFLLLFNFDPVSGAYLTVISGVLSVVGIYIVGSILFSKRVGIIASLLYATSPLAVYYMRFPYHTSPIPVFVIAYIFSLFKIIRNKLIYLPLAVLLLSILYNFEIATATIGAVLIWILISKLLKKEISAKEILNKKILILSVPAFIVPLVPMILYDIKNGFPQTLKFAAWSFYRVISIFGYNPQQAFSINKISIMFNFLFTNFTKLIFAQSSVISFIILIFLTVWMIYMFLKKKKLDLHNLIFLFTIFPLIIVIFNQIPSDAYLPMFFPVIILLFSLFIDFIFAKKTTIVPVSILIIILVAGNINFMFKNNFTFDGSEKFFTLNKRLQAASQILNITRGRDYNLIGKGLGSKFGSFTMNYEYLTWWLGHGPSKTNENLKIYLSEFVSGIKIEESNVGK